MSKKIKLVQGVGISDSETPVTKRKDGKEVWRCPCYKVWANLLMRAYDPNCHKKQPTYADCTVAPEWHRFSVFRAWMKTQDWEGMDLDKDVLGIGSKHYGPDTCVFIPHALNVLLNDSAAQRGKHPIGVTSSGKKKNPYKAMVSINGKQEYIGIYPTPEAAYLAYVTAKTKEIAKWALKCDDIRVVDGLVKHAGMLLLEARELEAKS